MNDQTFFSNELLFFNVFYFLDKCNKEIKGTPPKIVKITIHAARL